MVRRVIPLVTALIASVVVVSGSAPAANAAGSCLLHVPSRVAIGRPYIAITLTMSGDCVNGGYGSWDLYHPTQGFQDITIQRDTNRYLGFLQLPYDWFTQLAGRYRMGRG
jgi:hypothetical protein